MADTVEMQDIRGLDIDKTVKGFALTEYIFKNDCNVTSMTGDSVRWYQETAADLTATTPATITNVSPLSTPATLEASWTRNTSYVRKYIVEGFISMEDAKSADIDVISRTLLRLTRAVTKQVDTRIWDILTESRSVVNINSVSSTAAWDAGSGQNPIEDILEALYDIESNGYDTSNAVLYLSPKDKRSLLTWLISGIGTYIPGFSSEAVRTGVLMSIVGCKVKVSPNVTADYAAVAIPGVSVTWKQHTSITSRAIEEPGIGTKLRVWEIGEAILTDPKTVSLISNTQT